MNWQNTNPKRQVDNAYNTSNPPNSPNNSDFYVDGESVTQRMIDEILDKISASGYQNLTEREKKILFELSQKL